MDWATFCVTLGREGEPCPWIGPGVVTCHGLQNAAYLPGVSAPVLGTVAQPLGCRRIGHLRPEAGLRLPGSVRNVSSSHPSTALDGWLGTWLECGAPLGFGRPVRSGMCQFLATGHAPRAGGEGSCCPSPWWWWRLAAPCLALPCLPSRLSCAGRILRWGLSRQSLASFFRLPRLLPFQWAERCDFFRETGVEINGI